MNQESPATPRERLAGESQKVGLLQRGEPAILILKRFCVVSAI